jgi:monothiol glutaredoxin
MSVKERIEEQLGSHDVLLYMKGTPDFPQCGFSGQTVAALNAIGKPYAFVNIFEDPEIREGLKEYSNWPTFPQLYVKGAVLSVVSKISRKRFTTVQNRSAVTSAS